MSGQLNGAGIAANTRLDASATRPEEQAYAEPQSALAKRNRFILDADRDGQSCRQIADALQVSSALVYRVIREAKATSRSTYARQVAEREAQVQELFVSDDAHLNEIARQADVDLPYARHVLIEAGVDLSDDPQRVVGFPLITSNRNARCRLS